MLDWKSPNVGCEADWEMILLLLALWEEEGLGSVTVGLANTTVGSCVRPGLLKPDRDAKVDFLERLWLEPLGVLLLRLFVIAGGRRLLLLLLLCCGGGGACCCWF